MLLVAGVAARPAEAQRQSPDRQTQPADGALTLVGDMVLDSSNMRTSVRGRSKSSPAGFVGIDEIVSSPWPGGRMPVSFDASVSLEQQAFFFDVCGRWSAVAGVQCVAAVGSEDTLAVGNSGLFSGCNSTIGYSPYYRAMNLETACWHDSVVLHELGHAFGLLHEHQRPDRDAFVAVDYSNVQPGYSFAFNYAFGGVQGPYDLRSVMHYQWYAFAIDSRRPVMVPRGTQAPLVYDMGSGHVTDTRTLPSDGDAAGIRAIYGANLALPGAPRDLRLATVSGNVLTLAWAVPTSGEPVRSYRIDVGTDVAFTSLLASLPLSADITSVTGSLPNGVMHVRVVPLGAAGDGVPSKTLSFQLPGGQLIAPPQPPTLWAVQSRLNPITLAWQPTAGGLPTSYTVVAGTTPDGSDLGVFPVGTTTTLSGAVPFDTPIYVRVIAVNAAGTGVSSPLVVNVPSSPTPGRPTMQPALVTGHTVALSWTPPATGATSYLVRVRVADGGPVVAEWSVATTALAVPNVPSGRYRVSIAAVVSGVTGAESNAIWVAVP